MNCEDFETVLVKLHPTEMVVKVNNGIKKEKVLKGVEFLRTLSLIRACKTIIASYLSEEEYIPIDAGHEIEAILDVIDDLFDGKHATLDILDYYHKAKKRTIKKHTIMKMEKKMKPGLPFHDMELEEVEDYEKRYNAIVLFSENNSITLEPAKRETTEGGRTVRDEVALIEIQGDTTEIAEVVLEREQLQRLQKWLNNYLKDDVPIEATPEVGDGFAKRLRKYIWFDDLLKEKGFYPKLRDEFDLLRGSIRVCRSALETHPDYASAEDDNLLMDIETVLAAAEEITDVSHELGEAMDYFLELTDDLSQPYNER